MFLQILFLLISAACLAAALRLIGRWQREMDAFWQTYDD